MKMKTRNLKHRSYFAYFPQQESAMMGLKLQINSVPLDHTL